jgi:curved DNA-binding protein CbpA/SAM-dependent methyltransferase
MPEGFVPMPPIEVMPPAVGVPPPIEAAPIIGSGSIETASVEQPSIEAASAENAAINVERIESEIHNLNTSTRLTEEELNNVRSKLGLPPYDEDPPSIKPNKSRISSLEEQKKEYVESVDLNEKNSKGEKENVSPEMIAKEALNKMPVDKQGIVLGVGGNTENWKEKGWKTLDIDPTTGADFVIDTNYLEKVVPPASQDFLYSEYIKFDPQGWEGAAPARLLQEANKVLKMNGEFVIKSAIFENVPNVTTPEKETFLKLLKDHGFEVVTEVGEPHKYGENKSEQEITYYAKKTGEGYDPMRSESDEKTPQTEDVESWTNKTSYEKLGISKTATPDEINKAFRNLSTKYHPDTVHGLNDSNLSKNYEEVFKLISDARDELLDPQKRSEYDRKESPSDKFSEENGSTNGSSAHISELAKDPRIVNLARNIGIDSWFPDQVNKIKENINDLINSGVDKQDIQLVLEQAVFDNFQKHFKFSLMQIGPNTREIVENMTKTMKAYESLGIQKEKLLNSLGQEGKRILVEAASKFNISV